MKQVMIVRSDLKMGKGKIAAQCCHGCLGAYKKANPNKVKEWEKTGMAKVTCKVGSLDELLELKKLASANNVPHCLVVDAGKTQLPTSTTTVLAIGPDNDKIIDKITGNLKLL
ncbi:MAG: peptidyl-tRNA hydrolase [Methanobrevibacter sp.]|nr:peptidyl-tRNA hydrolase [Methanobrevibacter sp.]